MTVVYRSNMQRLIKILCKNMALKGKRAFPMASRESKFLISKCSDKSIEKGKKSHIHLLISRSSWEADCRASKDPQNPQSLESRILEKKGQTCRV
jgi:hypothetical protein